MSSEGAPEVAERTNATNANERTRTNKRTPSENPDAVRMRQQRAEKKGPGTFAGQRGGEGPSTKGNPLRPSDWSTMGEPLSPHEAERQLFWAHVGLAKVIRSDIDMAELKDEFEVAGENYAFVANKMWPPLRIMIRFVAPLVLVAVLVVIWGHMIAHTPWMSRVREWWAHRGDRDEPASPDYDPTRPVVVESPPVVHSNGAEPVQPPNIPRRPAVVRRFGGH